MLLSILIPTLESRREQFSALRAALEGQIARCGLSSRVEVVSLCDDGSTPTGAKRNDLVACARGEYVASVDDDDLVSDRYVELISAALQASPGADCVGITGEITYRGTHLRPFRASTRNSEYRTENGVFLMPANHLNPIRREIALRYAFEPVWRQEDSDWALRLGRAGALRSETFVPAPVYHYRSRRWWAYQILVERTEWLRHPLGLQLHNRHRLWRWLRAAEAREPSGPASAPPRNLPRF
jgi:hypothetical protein